MVRSKEISAKNELRKLIRDIDKSFKEFEDSIKKKNEEILKQYFL